MRVRAQPNERYNVNYEPFALFLMTTRVEKILQFFWNTDKQLM